MSGVYGNTSFVVVPKPVLEANISDRAFRLYAILASYADLEGRAFPGRKTLATRLKCSVKSVDRAVNELTGAELVKVVARYDDEGDRTSNDYFIDRAGVGAGLTPPRATADATGRDTGVPLTRTSNELIDIAQLTPDGNKGCKPESEDGFETFWQAYPRKTGKKAARSAYAVAIRDVAPSVLVLAAEAYAKDPNRDDAYTKHPTTWLNGGCWDDAPLPPRKGAAPRLTYSRPAEEMASW